MPDNKGAESLKDIFKNKKPGVKAPAYQWQDLALQVIKELSIPNFKRSSVFKVCKEHPKELVLRAMNDTKELVQKGTKWQYFFKIISEESTKLDKK